MSDNEINITAYPLLLQETMTRPRWPTVPERGQSEPLWRCSDEITLSEPLLCYLWTCKKKPDGTIVLPASRHLKCARKI